MIHTRVKKYDRGPYIGKNIVGELYNSSSSLISLCWRKATPKEEVWYNEGATMLPKFKVGDKVKVIKLDYGIGTPFLNTIHRIQSIKFNCYNNQYVYTSEQLVYFLEDMIELVEEDNWPKYFKVEDKAHSEEIQNVLFQLGYSWNNKGKVISFIDKPYLVISKDKIIMYSSKNITNMINTYHLTNLDAIRAELKVKTFATEWHEPIKYPLTPNKSHLSFDKNNFYLNLKSKKEFNEYIELCIKHYIKYNVGWRGDSFKVSFYGVREGEYICFVKTNRTTIPIYTLQEFKSILNNKQTTNEVFSQAQTKPTRTGGQPIKKTSGISKITTFRGFIGNPIQIGRGRIAFRKSKKFIPIAGRKYS